jgi:flagellar protein FliO/FliZ
MDSSALSSGAGLLAAVALLLVLLAAALWALRRGAAGAGWWRAPPRRLQLVEARALGPRHRVVLMRVDDKEVLIGVSPSQISVIDRWAVDPQPLPVAGDADRAAMERP